MEIVSYALFWYYNTHNIKKVLAKNKFFHLHYFYWHTTRFCQQGFGIAIKTVYLCIDMNDLHQTCIIVYCASSSAIDKQYIIVAKELGRKIALRNCAVVCGAGR